MYAVVPSPLGNLVLRASAKGLTHLGFTEEGVTEVPADLQDAVRQLGAYFARESQEFTVPLDPQGSDHDLQHWRELLTVPYGSTVSYREIAARLGTPGGARAVGQCNARNPIAILVPCHRVVSASGELTGYAGGIWRKQWLLGHESSQGSLGL
ncbi:MAG: methylated-DNA--[protein]-cysteine S-methyltransferase [Fimbriimonadaceae bacterium]